MQQIFSQFQLEGKPVSWGRYGSGHINETYRVDTDAPHAYILQKVNRRVFPNVRGLMENIIAVTEYLRRSIRDPRRVLTLVPARGGERYIIDAAGDCWRMYEFVTDSLCLDQPESAEDLRQSGVAFGTFQNQLADFPAQTLTEIIPHFHDTVDRYRQLKAAVQADRANRLSACRREVDWYLAREEDAGVLMSLMEKGELPLRVTHNDTKLNNVMLDRATRRPLCVIDLDTIMPGLAANDFGDSIRFGASTAAEDEQDLEKVHVSLVLYRAYAEGFLSACGGRLTPLEKETLPLGARLMTLECGARFLTDYLNGDVYFHVRRPAHNLDRARTQMKLVRDTEEKWKDIQQLMAGIETES